MIDYNAAFPNERQTPGVLPEMALRATNEIESVSGDYQRLYVPARVSSDSQYPFAPGDGVRLQVVTTTCDREVLVVTSELLEVDGELSDIELQRSSAEVQTDLSELAEDP